MTSALMVQGTGSHVGKSLLVAALCRIFRQDGISVAPFKSQNMALNAYVTREGFEMGRAQATQAEAAGILPQVEMNPLLLKATSDTSAQVILMGKVVGNMGVREYRDFKKRAWPLIEEAYRRLAAQYQLIVIEGAGSPVEVNLVSHDIVNMRVAEMAKAKVLLLGDIDRGGLFASFVGTWELLSRGDRKRVAGFIVNKFRGDPTLLEEGFAFLSERTGWPVLGVIPFLPDLRLPEEDGAGILDGRGDFAHSKEGLRIGWIPLPHASNFTDLDPFRFEPGVSVVPVTSLADLDQSDLIFIPGTKNTIEDLFWLRNRGFADRITWLSAKGKWVIGICGGYQILGEQISDPDAVEGAAREEKGIGLLPVSTLLRPQKTTTESLATLSEDGERYFGFSGTVSGYEIHAGETYSAEPLFFIKRPGGNSGDGAARGRVFGTYLHGLFDNDDFRRSFLRRVAPDRPVEHEVSYRRAKEDALNRLAAAVRASLRLEAVYDLIG